jgi:hypothetical protein
MDDCEENLGDFQPETSDSVVTEARLVAELNALRKHIDVVITKCRDSTVSRIPGFIDASEERVRQSVLDTVSTDYNQIGIRCVATRSEIKSELAKVRSALKLDNKAILESAQRIDGIVSQIEELNLISSDLSSRLGDHESLDVFAEGLEARLIARIDESAQRVDSLVTQIEELNLIRSDLSSRLGDHVSLDVFAEGLEARLIARIDESAHRVDSLVSQVEELNLLSSDLPGRLEDHESLKVFAEGLEARLITRIDDQNESIRALSGRIAVLEQRNAEVQQTPRLSSHREVVAPTMPLVSQNICNPDNRHAPSREQTEHPDLNIGTANTVHQDQINRHGLPGGVIPQTCPTQSSLA